MKDSERDWGCPDWRDALAYASSNDWDDERWRWEFKRRTWEIRGLYSTLVLQHLRSLERPWSPEVMWTDEFRDHAFALDPAQAARTGYHRLTNPLYPNPPHFRDLPLDFSYDTDLPNEALVQRFEGRRLTLARIEQALKREDRSLFLWGRIALVFDPNAPIQPQIEGLEEYLLTLRGSQAPQDRERDRREKWCLYLRIIDADNKGASYRDMAETLLDKASQGNKHKARDTLKAARKLQARI